MQIPSFLLEGYKPLGGQSRFSRLPFGVYPKTLFGIGFLTLYLLAVLYCYSHSYRDPTSVFFDPKHGYDKAYSLYREQQAEAFIAANNVNSSSPRTSRPPPENPAMCLGIATVARPKIQYIQKTVGSVLEGLTPEQRDSLHFVFFVAHSDPGAHPIHGDPWVQNLPDTLLEYDKNNTKQMEDIKGWEESGNHREKGFFDYTYLLNACKKTGAPYIAMLEGDVLAVPGWLPRSVEAAQTVDYQTGFTTSTSTSTNTTEIEHSQGSGEDEEAPSWLYIRMFWTETYLGWNSEEWPTYVFWSGIVWSFTVAALLSLRYMSPQARPLLTNDTVALLTCVCLPLSIILYFAAGRMSVRPPAPGIRRMDNFGCCSQGMVFSSRQVPAIVDAIDKRIEGYMDMLLETLASRNGLERWAIFPSLLQHIGGESSKGDAIADERARMIWNFAFERYGEVLEKGKALWR